jgi:hypothetical protein
MLKESDDKHIEAALYTLFYTVEFHSSIDDAEILPFLDNPLHWTNAIRLLRRIGDASLLPRLMPFLSYPDAKARVEAFRAFIVLGHLETFEMALYFLSDTDVLMRSVACLALGELKNLMAVEALIAKLQDNEISDEYSSCVSSLAAKALGDLKDSRAVTPLKNAVIYGNHETSENALRALWVIAGQSLELFYLEQLNHSYDETRCTAIGILGEFGKDDYVDLLISISQNESNYDVQSRAAQTLRWMGNPKAKEAYQYWYDFKRKS